MAGDGRCSRQANVPQNSYSRTVWRSGNLSENYFNISQNVFSIWKHYLTSILWFTTIIIVLHASKNKNPIVLGLVGLLWFIVCFASATNEYQ